MIIDETLLWSKLESYSPDNPNDALTFSQRLARENGWPPFFTERVVTEYKKFLFLCMISPHPVTPSDEVDQAWHLHLVYTKSYWNDLCKNILGKDLHHTPTEGGPAERDKFISYYESTLQLYRDKFGYAPPDDIWPPANKRFGDIDFVRANTQTHWLVPKKSWHKNISAFLLIITGLLVSVISSNYAFLVIFGISGLIVFAQGTQSGSGRGQNTSGGCGGGCGGDSGCNADGGCSGGCSGCGGGCGGGGD
ncbi:glycine-rich domain-containing protein [Paraflavitalea devenefica]|uniref:glycine-rich domain-containing protein n=1 Tax=Paraflavitalea devenefica TaxID=2716334 RepID=UPI001ABB541A|nr:hypothetical protein [Paraflavitalea devenefica]